MKLLQNSGLPIYKQIAEQLKSDILSGKLKEGDYLPSIRGLAQELRISVITTMKAYEELQAEGYPVETLEKIRKRLDDRLAGTNDKRKAVRTDLKMAGAMRKEFSETLHQVLTEREKAEPELAETEEKTEQIPVKKEDGKITRQPRR